MPARPVARTHAHAHRSSGSPEPVQSAARATAGAISACGTWCKVLCGVIVLGVFTVAHWQSLQEPVAGPLASDAEALGMAHDDGDHWRPEPVPGARSVLDFAPSMVLTRPLAEGALSTAGDSVHTLAGARRGEWIVRLRIKRPGPLAYSWPISLSLCTEQGVSVPARVLGEWPKRAGEAMLW